MPAIIPSNLASLHSGEEQLWSKALELIGGDERLIPKALISDSPGIPHFAKW